MYTVGSYEAKTHLPKLIARAARGEKILITHRGKPAAMLVAPQGTSNARSAVDELLEYSRKQNRSLKGISIKELIEEGRR